ncbi:MAG: L-methionine (R)-S-oxide reductase [Halanaerobiales bacterium]|nr:L-methionine (R)-S-oxide reductase [Halanaerobiales bacterium]
MVKKDSSIEKKEEKLRLLNQKLRALIKGEKDWLANLANAAALLYNELEEINWAGFYLYRNNQLILGPFQGLPACIRIDLGRGVCGSAAADRKTYLVPDVHQFSGHIACDEASESELVVPMLDGDRLIGVMDIDSPVKERFDRLDRKYLEEFVGILIEGSDFNKSK